MSLLRKVVLILCCLCVLTALLEYNAQAQGSSYGNSDQMIDKVLAAIDGEPVTLRDLNVYLSIQSSGQVTFLKVDDPRLSSALKKFVGDKLIEKEARQSGITVGDEELQAYVSEIMRENSLNQKSFNRLLVQRGLSREEYNEQVKTDILRARVVSMRVRSKINIVDEDVERYLDEHPALRPEEGALHLFQVMIPLPSGKSVPDQQQLARLENLRSKAGSLKALKDAAGDAFEDLGYLKEDDLREDYQRALEGVALGQTSSVFSMPGRAGFLYLEDRGGGLASEALKNKVKDIMFQEQFQAGVEHFISVELPQKYDVEYSKDIV